MYLDMLGMDCELERAGDRERKEWSEGILQETEKENFGILQKEKRGCLHP